MTSSSASPSTTAAPAAPPVAPAGARRAGRSSRSRREPVRRTGAAAWVELTKPRIALLLLITCVAAMLVEAHGLPPAGVLLATAVGLVLSSGGASTLNHVLDRDIDRLMSRTAKRPVAAGTIGALPATVFGVGLMLASLVGMWLLVNPLAAVLTLVGGLFYVLVYTALLKRTTPQNIVIGGAAGAIPPLVGCAAVSGSLSAQAWVLFGIVFLWTPPHFWALALLIREQYARANVPMLPVVAGDRATIDQVWLYSLVLLVASVVPVATGTFGLLYGVAALLLGARLASHAWAMRALARRTPGDAPALVLPGGALHAAARRTFLFSMLYLALLFVAAVVDQTLLTVSLR